MVWAMFALLLVVPVLMIKGLVDLSAVIDAIDAGWRRLRGRAPLRPADLTVQQLAADLRRLADHLEQVDSSDAPAKMARLRAAALAYDDLLLSAARALDVPAPERPPLESIERLETEAGLAQHGLVW